jgi:alanine dehydrogenase
VVALASKGWETATAEDPALKLGLNVHDGKVYNHGVAAAFGLPLAAAG